MASSKDIQQTSRPLTHRPSLSNSYTNSNGGRQVHSRTNSHTMISGPLTAGHRVGSRRKSVSNNATSNANMKAFAAAAAAAGIGDANDKVPSLPMAIGNRRPSKSGGLRPELAGLHGIGLPSPPASMPAHNLTGLGMDGTQDHSDSAVDDQENISPEDEESSQNARARRASDGQPLLKEGRKFNRPEIYCQKCGKGYKHSSCLSKHMWEHTPEWSYTSKLLISKHQQVQLLEAATVLVAMNTQPTTPPDSAREISPTMSGGFSEQLDGRSSANTTPPPQMDSMHAVEESGYTMSPMLSDDDEDMRGGLSRSLHPLPSDMAYYQQEPSPTPGPSSMSGEADHLAKAVAMLSCSYGSNTGSLTNQIPLDIPPVPPVPVQFLSHASLGQSPFLNSFPAQAPESFTRGDRRRGSDVKMEDGDDEDIRPRARSDEEDYGVFGQMEE